MDPWLSIEDLLDDKYAVIGCRGGHDPEQFWDINIGVAFFNLKHKDFGNLMSQWVREIKWVSEKKLHGGSTENYVQMGARGAPVRDDQQMFHFIMEKHPKGRQMIKRYYKDEEGSLFNYNDGKYIVHLIRADNKDQDVRFVELLQIKNRFFSKLLELQKEPLDAAQRALERKKQQKMKIERRKEGKGEEGREGMSP